MKIIAFDFWICFWRRWCRRLEVLVEEAWLPKVKKSKKESSFFKLTTSSSEKFGRRSTAVLFFASRAKRIADGINQEALRVARSSSTRFVGARRANLRASPSTNSPIVAVVAGGSPVFSEREKKGWVRVRTSSGRTGWMHESVFASR